MTYPYESVPARELLKLAQAGDGQAVAELKRRVRFQQQRREARREKKRTH